MVNYVFTFMSSWFHFLVTIRIKPHLSLNDMCFNVSFSRISCMVYLFRELSMKFRNYVFFPLYIFWIAFAQTLNWEVFLVKVKYRIWIPVIWARSWWYSVIFCVSPLKHVVGPWLRIEISYVYILTYIDFYGTRLDGMLWYKFLQNHEEISFYICIQRNLSATLMLFFFFFSFFLIFLFSAGNNPELGSWFHGQILECSLIRYHCISRFLQSSHLMFL